MFKDINISIRNRELKDTYSLVESEFGTIRLKHVVTGQEINLSFLDSPAAMKYAERKNLVIT